MNEAGKTQRRATNSGFARHSRRRAGAQDTDAAATGARRGRAQDGAIAVLDYYAERKIDPGYQGVFEKLYTDAFVEMMGGGYADAVATGTAALYVAVAALDLPKGSEVMVSPITDPGTLAAVVLNGLKPRLVDSKPGQLQCRPRAVRRAHHARSLGGDHRALCRLCRGRSTGSSRSRMRAGIKVIEDCSQAHFAKQKAKPVGTFGDIAAFSTMYRKAHMTGPSGGLVYSRDLETVPQRAGPCRSRQAALARGLR